MTQRSLGTGFLVLILLGSLAGCEWWQAEEQEELDLVLPSLPSAGKAVEPLPSTSEEKLELRLNLGDRFPLQKIVKQTLTQASPDGPVASHSTLELLLAITVEEVRDDRKRLGVRYQHVRYRHDVAGQRVEYDSNSPPVSVPLEVQAYHGLVNNGFSFWIGPDNRIVELVGFGDFLKRCVEGVPPAHRQAVRTNLAALSGDAEIANFVDDSIGFLPPRVEGEGRHAVVKIGDTWTRERQLVQPIPMYLSSKCTLKALNDHIAEIDIVGSITCSTTYGPSDQPNKDVRITVRGGHAFGRCIIDRSTGLPLNSQIERRFNMLVQLSDGVQFEQQKQIVTTIRAFPQQVSTETAGRRGALREAVHNPPTHISPRNRVVGASHETGQR